MLNSFSPLSCLNNVAKNLQNIIEAVSLTPSDTLRFQQKFNDIYSPPNPEFNDLTVNSNFANKFYFTRNNVKKFELDLKKEFLKTQENQTSLVEYKKLINELKKDANFVQVPFDPKFDLPILIEYLAQQNMLPCLAFSYIRSRCEVYTKILLEYYEKKEIYLRKTKYAEKIEFLEKNRVVENIAKKKLRDKDAKKKSVESKDDGFDPDISNLDYSLLDSFLPECVLGEKRCYSGDEINTQLSRSFNNEHSDWRCKAILRGFAYHHAGLNNKKRVCVESLFRNKLIQLVFCTSTLAQGIHVPCKTVIFLEDSIFLNAGLFKQCAGRAGRRGFDNHASCIFLNIPEIKCKQLVSSKPAPIHPSFIVSPTVVLKLFNLISSGACSTKNLINLLKNGLLMHLSKSEILEMQNKFYFMFCTEFLLENSLIALNGNPIGLAKFVTYFHYHEPSNLALSYLLSSGTLVNFCNREIDSTVLEMKLLTLLSYMFNKVTIYDPEYVKKQHKINTWNSRVVLGDLPEEFKSSIKDYNQQVHFLFKANLLEQFELVNTKLAYRLPLSGYDYFNEFENKSSGINYFLVLRYIVVFFNTIIIRSVKKIFWKFV